MTRPLRYRYKARVLRVIDAANYLLVIDVGFSFTYQAKIRLSGVAPHSEGSKEAEEATAYATDLLLGKEIEVQTFRSNSHNSWLATLYLDSLAINPHLVSLGKVKVFKR